MANHPENVFAKKGGPHRPLPSDPRYEIVFENGTGSGGTATRAFDELKARVERGSAAAARELVSKRAPARRSSLVATRVFAELKTLAGRGGSALGDAYALAAGAVLHRIERLEDLNAERRLRQRSPGVVSPQAVSSQVVSPGAVPSGPASPRSPSSGPREPGRTSRPHSSPPPKVKP